METNIRANAHVGNLNLRNDKNIRFTISPELVPMTRPSKGVVPIDVSTERPPQIAAAERPSQMKRDDVDPLLGIEL